MSRKYWTEKNAKKVFSRASLEVVVKFHDSVTPVRATVSRVEMTATLWISMMDWSPEGSFDSQILSAVVCTVTAQQSVLSTSMWTSQGDDVRQFDKEVL